ncbi:muscarinic acetylcholine receptor M3-like [Aplysia californica]|uniref:Muscarinic acetylcholine receptor M3-like n=1 Tax=Aplysia californica TaxID=6500 RepID=A0ABM0KB88_APLCA|nr:muscarinic acetylcholine receptor M3-like [Aplysia californica]
MATTERHADVATKSLTNRTVETDMTSLLRGDNISSLFSGSVGGLEGLTSFLDENLTSASSPSAGSLNLTCLFNATFNSSLCDAHGKNETVAAVVSGPHVLWVSVFMGVIAGIVSLVTILGNITVLLAFGLERTIRQPTNYFLASLAVSDLLIGTFSMPLYTQYYLLGKWPLGPWLCDLWLSLDWTVCLTSQYTVFLITMDRFLSVKIPAKYRNWRTERKVMVMIALTWIGPAIIFFTSIVGWQYFVGKRTVGKEECEVQFMSDAMFTFLLTIGYYWITLFVMCVLYGGIYKVALDLQRKSDAKHKKIQSTMELAADNAQNAIRSFGEGGSNNNSSGGGDSQVPPASHNNCKTKSMKTSSTRKSVKAALPCPVGAPHVNTTSFTSAQDKDEDRSSSPAFASDDDNSSSGGAAGAGKSPQAQGGGGGGGYSRNQTSSGAGGTVNNALFANTGGLVRSLHGDLFFPSAAPPEPPQYLLQPPPPYSRLYPHPGSEVSGSDTDGGGLQHEADSVYSSATSDRLEKQTLLQQDNNNSRVAHGSDINRGCRFIDEKSLLATLNESAALLPALTGDSELDDSDVADLNASSPIWKRRSSLPPLASDVFDLDDDISDTAITTDMTTTTTLATATATPVSNNSIRQGPEHSGHHSGTDDEGTHGGGGGRGGADAHARGEGGASADGKLPTTTTSNNNHCNSYNYPTGPPSETNTTEDGSHPDPHCLSAVRVRRQKDTRLHAFVKSVRSRNSRRRNRRERKSKSENRARKALRTISFILGAFVLCWTPYHVNLMVMALCKDCINMSFYAFSYYLCYLNSPINPLCYAFANAQFKRTFLRIMKFDWHRT